MAAAELTTTTVRYLFASTWAPGDDSTWSMHVPGAEVPGLDTAANLLEIAIWSLREQGLLEAEQIRPVEKKKVMVMGGKSFSRLTVLDTSAKLPGLEGAFLDAWRGSQGEGRGLDDKLGQFLSGDDEKGTRGLVLALGMKDRAPWETIAAHCRDEAHAAGLIELEGRSKKPVVADREALDSLKPRDDEIAAARQKYREREPDLDHAVIADCSAAVRWAHTAGTRDNL